jgi:hypothetical protein
MGMARGGARAVTGVLAMMLMVCLTWGAGGQARASETDYPVSSTTIRSLIEASRHANGDIVTLRKNLGLFVLEDDASAESERDLFNRLIFSEMQLLGRMLPLSFKNGARPKDPLAEKYSQLVIFRDPEDMKIAEYESTIPGFGAAVESVRDQLGEEGCLFFSQQDETIADDLLVAYVFVGRQYARPSSCLHSGILKAFGIQRKPGDKSPYADRFLVDLIGMQLIDHCSAAHGMQRVSCVQDKINAFK